MGESKQIGSNWTAVLIVAGYHYLDRAVQHGCVRIRDILNESNSDFLAVGRPPDANPRNMRPSVEAIVLKSEIDCVPLLDASYESPIRRQYALLAKQLHCVSAHLRDRGLVGMSTASGTMKPVAILGQWGAMFFPVTQATLTEVGEAQPPIIKPVPFVNKARVVLFQATNA